MEGFDDDTHFCLKCHSTIVGLDNYVTHRKNNCLKDNQRKSPLPSQILNADDTFSLKADDFFSSLELQSSSKKLIQPSTSGKSTSGVLTRSKITAFARDLPEHSKSGKNAWIGANQIKELDFEDPQSKLSKTDTSSDCRKDEIGKQKDLSRLHAYDESDDDSDDLCFDDETSDEDAPPKNHTGGKWKPSSPIYWKSTQNEREWRPPPPSFTGGKWKPIPTKRTVSPPLKNMTHINKDSDDIPPPSFTGSKWSQSKKHVYFEPPSDYTKGKWKPKSENQQEDDFPPPEHTKGKWKPSNIPVSQGISPAYTKGKWLPPSKSSIDRSNVKPERSPFRKSGGTVQYWCRTCDRRLASKIVYERHLKSELHFKRTLRDNELEDNLNFTKDERRSKRKISVTTRTIEPEPTSIKRKRRKTYEKCEVCNSKVNLNSIGKHLISHYHCRKGDLSSESSHKMVLDHIRSIIDQSPFQCKTCKFYFNTHKDFLDHWLSESHVSRMKEKSGDFVCSYCKILCQSNEDMYRHLISEEHSEVVSVINRSVPIIIKKVEYKQCNTCNEKFQLNIQLLKHSKITGHANALDDIGIKCEICDHTCPSKRSLQRHKKKDHNIEYFICGACDLSFPNVEDVKKHRNTMQHHHNSTKKNETEIKKSVRRNCKYCQEVFEDFMKLKEHIEAKHAEYHSRCPICGMVFSIPQQLSVHLRTKSCSFDGPSSGKFTCRTCSFSTNSSANLLFHETLHGDSVMMSQSGSKNDVPHYKCPKCMKLFPKSSLEGHLRTHTKERPYSCSFCNATFVRKNNWMFHEKKHTSGSSAKRGKMTPEGERPFLCSTCGASFRKRFILHQHMKIHTGKLYKCIEADCIFAGRSFSELKAHYHTHFDLKNFKCNLCDYRGKTKQQLTRHLTVHDKVKKFKCKICPFTARTSHHLKRHSRLHTGSKPYSCPHCTHVCNSVENLRKHILSTNKHSGKSIYHCKFCTDEQYQTNYFKEFKAHLISVHPEDVESEGRIETSIGIYGLDGKLLPEEGNNQAVGTSAFLRELDQNEDDVDVPEGTLAAGDNEANSSQTGDTLPMISLVVSKQEDEEEETRAEWSLIECYDVEESGNLVPFNKDENDEVLFEEHF